MGVAKSDNNECLYRIVGGDLGYRIEIYEISPNPLYAIYLSSLLQNINNGITNVKPKTFCWLTSVLTAHTKLFIKKTNARGI
jgi:hypothetical protein